MAVFKFQAGGIEQDVWPSGGARFTAVFLQEVWWELSEGFRAVLKFGLILGSALTPCFAPAEGLMEECCLGPSLPEEVLFLKTDFLPEETGTTVVEGTLTTDTVWSPALGTIIVTSPVMVPANLTLRMEPGTLVKMARGSGIGAVDGGRIQIEGTAEQPVVIQPMETGALWEELGAGGENSSITVRHAEISGGRTAVRNGAAGLFEDAFFHDYLPASCSILQCPILLSSFASSMEVRRCHFRNYHETLFRDGVVLIEESLFEYMSRDGVDFDGVHPGTILRRSTFRHGILAPANVDAIDVGPSQRGPSLGVVIEGCLIYNFPNDKGVSIGDAPLPALGTVVRNCLIYACDTGVQVKDGAEAEVYQCTIAGNRRGFHNFNKANPSALAGGGHTINAHNNILWDNETAVWMRNGATLVSDHSNFENTNWPGEGNLRIDPLFVNAPWGDYRLSSDSTSRGAGRHGEDLGARFPVGAPMASSHPGFQSVELSGSELVLRFWADPEKSYTLQSSPTGRAGTWSKVADIPVTSRPELVEIRQSLAAEESRFYHLITTRQP